MGNKENLKRKKKIGGNLLKQTSGTDSEILRSDWSIKKFNRISVFQP